MRQLRSNLIAVSVLLVAAGSVAIAQPPNNEPALTPEEVQAKMQECMAACMEAGCMDAGPAWSASSFLVPATWR